MQPAHLLARKLSGGSPDELGKSASATDHRAFESDSDHSRCNRRICSQGSSLVGPGGGGGGELGKSACDTARSAFGSDFNSHLIAGKPAGGAPGELDKPACETSRKVLRLFTRCSPQVKMYTWLAKLGQPLHCEEPWPNPSLVQDPHLLRVFWPRLDDPEEDVVPSRTLVRGRGLQCLHHSRNLASKVTDVLDNVP